MRNPHASLALLFVAGCSDVKEPSLGSQSHPLSDLDASATESPATSADAPEASTVDSRRAEIEAWALAYHDRVGHVVVLSETLDDGTVVDWVDMDSDPTTKEEHPSLDVGPPPEGVERHQIQELSGPTNTVPYMRPEYLPYVEGRSGHRTLEEYIAAIPSGNPNAISNRLYVALIQEVWNRGVSAAVNGSWYNMDLPTSPEFVINEIITLCEDSQDRIDAVGLAVGHHPYLYSGYRLMAEFFANGVGNWVPYDGYHQVHPTIGPGSLVSATSTSNGTQYEAQLDIHLLTSYSPNRWYYYWSGTAIGYVDVDEAELEQLDHNSCWVQVYGEAMDPYHASGNWMNADMANGNHPTGSTFSANYGTRGFFRLPAYRNSSLVGTTLSAGVTNFDSACYSGLKTTDGSPSSSWNPTVFFGGDGGNTVSCD